MRSPPADLSLARVRGALADGWGIGDGDLSYVAKGGGSHHWTLVADGDPTLFVTVDDLDDKDWLAATRDSAFGGLRRALETAASLRDAAGLDFVVAPLAAGSGDLVARVDDRYAISVFPFVEGRSHEFGPYSDARLRRRALDMVAALHGATAAVEERAPRHVPDFGGHRDLDAFLAEPERPWDRGPYGERARELFRARTGELAALAGAFDELARRVLAARRQAVITHGEPHPGNLLSAGDRVLLIDWDTTALAAPERDLWLVAATDEDTAHYEAATGRTIDPDAMTLYRLRWYLDDLASAVRMFRNPHARTNDTDRWFDALAPNLAQLPNWLAS